MSLLKIEVEFGSCLADCAHCPVAKRHNKGPKEIIEIMPRHIADAVNRFVEVVNPETLELDISSQLTRTQKTVFDFLDRPDLVNLIDLAIDLDDSFDEQLAKLQGRIQYIREAFPSLQHLTIAFSRSFQTLDQQVLHIPRLLKWLLSSLKNLPSTVFLALGSNEVPEESMSQMQADFQDVIHQATGRESPKSDDMKDMIESACELGAKVWSEDSFSSANGNGKKHIHGAIFLEGGQRIVLSTNFYANTGKGRLPSLHHLIDSLTPEGGHEIGVVHFSAGAVNLYHTTLATNLPGVWVPYKYFHSLLDEAKSVGYQQAVLDHFRSKQEEQV